MTGPVKRLVGSRSIGGIISGIPAELNVVTFQPARLSAASATISVTLEHLPAGPLPALVTYASVTADHVDLEWNIIVQVFLGRVVG